MILEVERIDQIQQLVEQLPVKVQWLETPYDAPGPGITWRGNIRNIVGATLPKLVDDFTYSICLHEFGHVYGELKSDWYGSKYAGELEAWVWARRNCLGVWSAPMQEAMEHGLYSHIDNPYSGLTKPMVQNFLQTLEKGVV